MRKTTAVLAILAATGAVAAAGPVDVVYSVSGSSGNWTLDFSVTNNLNPSDMDIYFFGVLLDTGRNIAGSPPDWDPNSWPTWDNSPYGGSSTIYNNNWIDFTFDGLFPGNTLSGFKAVYTGANAPSSVQFFAYGYGVNGGQYQGNDYFNNPGNPGFEGKATPAPASLALLGLGGLAATRRRR